MSLMQKIHTKLVASSIFLEVLPLLGKVEFIFPAEKVVAVRAQRRFGKKNPALSSWKSNLCSKLKWQEKWGGRTQ